MKSSGKSSLEECLAVNSRASAEMLNRLFQELIIGMWPMNMIERIFLLNNVGIIVPFLICKDFEQTV